MKKTVEESLMQRRSYYALGNKIDVSYERIENLVCHAASFVPSAFNSQSSRLVLLSGDSHLRFWNNVCNKLSAMLSTEIFEKSKKKIERGFAGGYGTVLFYEDMATVEKLQKDFPLYSDAFPYYSQHTSAMHQLALWMMLEDEGLGASLQHYNPLIDDVTRDMFSLPEKWKLVAQMPFGKPEDVPAEKTFLPIEEKVKIFR